MTTAEARLIPVMVRELDGPKMLDGDDPAPYEGAW
jgi:hypothetical protein